MSILYNKTDHFKDSGIDFPSVTFCGAVLNDFLKNGMSLNQFEDKYKRLSKSQTILKSPSFESGLQLALQNDVWGLKEVLLIFKHSTEYDLAIVHGIRNSGEFATVDKYLKSNSRARLMQDTPGSRYFNFDLPPLPDTRTRELVVNLVRENEQASKTTLMINF